MRKSKNQTDLVCKVVGEDGNIYNILGVVVSTLNRNGYEDKASEVEARLQSCNSYYEALNMMQEYVIFR